MSTLELGFVTILAIFSLGLAGLLGWYLFRSLIDTFRRAREGLTLRQALREIELVDHHLARHLYPEALQGLQRGVIYDILTRENLLPVLRDHYQNILSRIFIVAEQASFRPDNITDLERLFAERIELLFLNTRAESAYNRLLEKRERAGKDVPSWSREEFQQKSTQIRHELGRNRTELHDHLEKLFSLLRRDEKDESITYH